MALPLGIDTLDQLAQSTAGRVYLAARCLGTRNTYHAAESFIGIYGDHVPEHVETCNPPHPECYARRYEDGSILVVSNAEDEVWADEADYLAHYDLVCVDDPDLGWLFTAV